MSSMDLIEDLIEVPVKASKAEIKVVNSIFGDIPDENNTLTHTLTDEHNITSTFSIRCIIKYIVLTFIVMIALFIPNDTLINFLPKSLATATIINIIKAILVSITFYLIGNSRSL